MSRAKGESPISYPINVSRLPRKGTPIWLEADEAQRLALAKDHDLDEVLSLRFDLDVAPWQGRGVRLDGRVRARIVQACVVTLEPVIQEIDEEIAATLVPAGSRLDRPQAIDSGELVLDPDGPDMPETFSGDVVDAGAIAEQFFSLDIDPYPRKEGAALESGKPVEEAENDRGPLYEQLRALKRKT